MIPELVWPSGKQLKPSGGTYPECRNAFAIKWWKGYKWDSDRVKYIIYMGA